MLKKFRFRKTILHTIYFLQKRANYAYAISGISVLKANLAANLSSRQCIIVVPLLSLEYQVLKARVAVKQLFVHCSLCATFGISVFASHVNSNSCIVLYVLTLDYQFLRAMLTVIRKLFGICYLWNNTF